MMRGTLRILMLTPHPNIQGPLPKVIPLLISALCQIGCRVASEPWGRHSDQERLLTKALGRAQDLLGIHRALRREQPDVLMIHTAHDWSTIVRDVALLLTTRNRRPATILEFHGSLADRLVTPGYKLFKAASRWLLQLSDAALLLSTEEQRQWQRFYPLGRFYVVDYPFLPSNDQSPVNQLPWVLPGDKPVLLFVGRLIRQKGIFDLLDAMADLKERVACHLLVAGDGAARAQVLERIESLGLANHVTCTGYLQNEELKTVYRSAQVFVLPTTYSEGFPVVLIEAMDAGLPIVTTRIRGAADRLREGINALFVPPGDSAALADTLEQLLSDSSLRAKMRQANRKKVQEFAPEVVARHYLGILEEVISRHECAIR